MIGGGPAAACRPSSDGVELLQQVQLVCPRNGLGAVTYAQLAVGVRDVTLNGGAADEELICNLLVPPSSRDET